VTNSMKESISSLKKPQPRSHPPGKGLPLGIDRGRFEVPEDFNSPLPPDVLASFYGDESLAGRKARSKSR
jgi:hypothetical protein